MKKSLGMISSLVMVAAVALAGACATTQSPREQVDDTAIHSKVKTKLTADRFSNISNVDINVTNGIVTLAGEVPSAQVKEEAEREAWSVKGVRQVINNLQVGAGTGTGSTPGGDTEPDGSVQ